MKQRRRSPLVSSVDLLMGLAGSILVFALAGMTVYAGGHLHNANAPLQPQAVAAAAPAAAAATTTTSATTGRLQLSRGVTTTTTTAVTRTHHS